MNLKEHPKTWQLAIMIVVSVASALLLGELCSILWDALGGGYKSLVVMIGIAALVVAGLLWLDKIVQRRSTVSPVYLQVLKGSWGTLLCIFIVWVCIYSIQQHNYLLGLHERQVKIEQRIQESDTNYSDHKGDFVCVNVDSLNLVKFDDVYLNYLKSQQGKTPNQLLLPDALISERIQNLIGKEKYALLFTYTSLQPVKVLDEWVVCEWVGDNGGKDNLSFTFFLNTSQNLMFGQVQVMLNEFGVCQDYQKLYVEYSGNDEIGFFNRVQSLPENIKQLIIPSLIPFDKCK